MFRKIASRGKDLINNGKKNKSSSVDGLELKSNSNSNLIDTLSKTPNNDILDTNSKLSSLNSNSNRPLPKVPYNDRKEFDNKSITSSNLNAYGYSGAFGYTCHDEDIIRRLRLVSSLDLTSIKSKKSSVDFENDINRYSPENSEDIYTLSRKNSVPSKLEPAGLKDALNELKVEDLLSTTQDAIEKVEKINYFYRVNIKKGVILCQMDLKGHPE